MGYRVVAVDQNPLAPGFEIADIKLHCSLLKPGQIYRMLREHLSEGPVRGIICRSHGAATISAALLAHRFNLPAAKSQNTGVLRSFRNKRELKARLGAKGIPVPRSYERNTIKERWQILRAPLPLVVRPSVGHGKLKVEMLDKVEKVRSFLRKNPPGKGDLLIEEYVPGPEITVLGLVSGGEYYPVSLSQKTVSGVPPCLPS